MEKEPQPDSMATITMKAEYPPSEVYSASEPPPAYRHRVPASVQIARIAALTVVASAFILGSFVLASSWVTARASCRQLDQLDAMLDKELALEGRAYGNDALLPDEPLPLHNAHALRAAPPAPADPAPPSPSPASMHKEDALNQAETKIDENKLQSIDKPNNKNELPISDSNEDNSESDSSMEEEEDLDVFKPLLKLPIHFDLDELASTFLSSNQKGRMNCMMERRSEDPLERRFPFNILGAFAPRAANAERIAIICRGGDDARAMGGFPEPQSQVFAFPLTGPMRLPLRPAPPAPRPAPPAPMMPEHRAAPFMPLHHRPAPFPLSMPWDSSDEQGAAPREMRIHVQRVIAVPAPAPAPPAPPAPHNMPPAPDAVSHFAPPPPPMQPQHHEQPTILHQFVPQPAPTQELEQPEMESAPVQISLPWGLTADELQAIRHSAEDARRDQQLDNDMQEVKTIVNTIAAAAEAEAAAQAHADEQRRAHEQRMAEDQRQVEPQHPEELRSEEGVPEVPQEAAQPPRAPRTIMLPQDVTMDQRPHFMQPRSVRAEAGAPTASRQKRATRCECY